MKNRKLFIIVTLCLTVLLLEGCNKQGEDSVTIGSEVWATMPQLTYGVMEYDQLKVLPWNSGRSEATSFETIAETHSGYYMAYSLSLFYADKANLSIWVPVCKQPDCGHRENVRCDARLYYNNFVIRDNRIYYQLDVGAFPELYLNPTGGNILVSMAADGTDKKLAFAAEKAYLPNTASYMTLLTSHNWLYNAVSLNADGTQTAYSFRITDAGMEQIAAVENFAGTALLRTGEPYTIYGDRIFQNGVLDGKRSSYFLFENNKLHKIDLDDIPVTGSYISGDILRYFISNDGYYDIQIKSRAEVKLADAQLENSIAYVVLPNCIVESTLLGRDSLLLRTAGQTHRMMLFDGASWREVKMPEALINAGSAVYLTIEAVTSSSILLIYWERGTSGSTGISQLYQIDLGSDDLEMKHCAELSMP